MFKSGQWTDTMLTIVYLADSHTTTLLVASPVPVTRDTLVMGSCAWVSVLLFDITPLPITQPP